jgi:hypothetical protein
MRLLLPRFYLGPTCTIGRLFVGNDFQCYILEDRVREELGKPVEKWKVKGATAIPSSSWLLSMGLPATYSVTIDDSTRFGRPMPHILNVPGFDGIRIHSGNSDADTEGCPLTGTGWTDHRPDWLANSRMAFDLLFPKLERAMSNGEPVTITITNGEMTT